MRGENRSSDRSARFEQAGADGDVLHVEYRRNFGRRSPFHVAEDEHFALSHGERRGDCANELHCALSIHSHAWIGDVNVDTTFSCRTRGRPHSEDYSSRYAVQPGVEWSVTPEAPKLAVNTDEDFLCDVVRLVLIAGERDRPAKHNGSIPLDEGRKRARVALACEGDEPGRFGQQNREPGHTQDEPPSGVSVYSPECARSFVLTMAQSDRGRRDDRYPIGRAASVWQLLTTD